MQLVVLAPLVMLVAGKRIGGRARSTFVLTAGITSLAAAGAYALLCPDPSDLWGALYFFVLWLPVITIPLAGVLAARIGRQPAQVGASVMAALLGHAIGVFIVFTVVAPNFHGFLGYLVDVAPPALYASAAATVAATLGFRT